MPLYSYVCSNCGMEKEYLEDMNTNIKHRCVECQQDMQKTLSVSNFVFNGPGFYENDYKRKK